MAKVTKRKIEAQTEGLKATVKYDGELLQVCSRGDTTQITPNTLESMLDYIEQRVTAETPDGSVVIEDSGVKLSYDTTQRSGRHTVGVRINNDHQTAFLDDLREMLDLVQDE